MAGTSAVKRGGLSDFLQISDLMDNPATATNLPFVRALLRVSEADSEWFSPRFGFVANLWIQLRTVALLPLPYPPVVEVRIRELRSPFLTYLRGINRCHTHTNNYSGASYKECVSARAQGGTDRLTVF